MKSRAFSLFHRPAALRTALVSLASFAALTASITAAELYWDADSTTAGIQGGDGTWNSSTFWNPASDGSGTAQNWTADADANFTANTNSAASSIDREGNTYNVTNLDKTSTQNLTLTNGALNVSGNITVTNGTTTLGTVNLTGTSGTQTINFGNVNGTSLAGTLVFGNRNFTVNSAATSNNESQFRMVLDGSGNLIFDKPSAAGTNRIGLYSTNGSTWTGDFVVNNTGLAQLNSTTFFTKNNLVQFDANGLVSARQDFTIGGLSGSTGSIRSEVNPKTMTIDTSVLGDASFGGNVVQYPNNTLLLNVTKTGAGTQTFSGNNTYLGATTVNGGKLFINGVHTSTTGTSSTYSVTNANSTLGGSGRIAVTGTATVNTGAILAPGASSGAIGTLTMDGINNAGTVLSMASGAKFAFDLAGDGSSSDQIQLWNYSGSSDLALNDNVIDLTLSGTPGSGTYTKTLFAFYSDDGATLTSSGIASGLAIGTLGPNISSASLIYNANTIDLQYTVSGGGGAPEIAVEQPAATDIANGGSKGFGTVTLGTNTSLTFTIRNTGTANLNLTGSPLVAVSGTNAADFTVTALPTTPVTSGGGTTTFTVKFQPLGTTGGARSALLTIANNDSDEGSFTINVSGTAQTPYEAWSGAADFDADANGDGVKNGLAFLLGAANKNDSALNKLPAITQSGGGLVLTFQCLKDASRGSATLSVEHSSDLGISDAWLAALVSDAGTTANNVSFSVSSASSTLNNVTATIANTQAVNGKLFGRLKANNP